MYPYHKIEHTFTTKSNIKKPLLNLFDINIMEQNCSVNEVTLQSPCTHTVHILQPIQSVWLSFQFLLQTG